MARPQLKKAKAGGAYFTAPAQSIQFVSSGCVLLDCVLGGGWPMGRVVNVVGDKSTGKTLLAIEACANFKFRFPKGSIRYVEREFAFDVDYAEAVGLPPDEVDFVNTIGTVEGLYDDIEAVCKAQKAVNVKEEPVLYVVDSLDSISDDAEMERGISDSSYGGNKAKKLSEFFRKKIGPLSEANVLLFIVSQVRDNIGAMFGEKHTRSGGKALDFYASQVLWLAHLKTLKAKRSGAERPTGAQIRAKCKKNKVGLPLRQADFYIRFGFGLDDVQSHLEWLEETGRLEEVELTKTKLPSFMSKLDTLSDSEYRALRKTLGTTVKSAWYEIEKEFLPTRRKYA